MTDVAGEADSGGTRASDLFHEVLNTRSSRTPSGLTITVRPPEDINNDSELEKVTPSTNYDSADGSTPLLHKCDHCKNYETSNHSALLAHIAQAHSSRKELENSRKELDPDSLPTVLIENNNNNPAIKLEEKLNIVMASVPVSTVITANSTNVSSKQDPQNPRKHFECDICNMKFSNGANMRRHRMRHSGVKPYECRVCQKRFFRKDHLAEHFTTHTKTLPYHCPICNRGFQRQIAMRAHFQNEHVGQHDLVKSCPLCSYRAGSMKSLRVHFFNRHGIDLDNPGPPGSQSSLLAAAAAAGQLGSLDPQTMSTLQNLTVSVKASQQQQNYSDSGESNGGRSADNATPPMHFLMPHVEISMADPPPQTFSPNQNDPLRSSQINQSTTNDTSSHRILTNGDCDPNSPQSADSNSATPSSSLIHTNNNNQATGQVTAAHIAHINNLITNNGQLIGNLSSETTITPSISLIPIKQEPMVHSDDGMYQDGPGPTTTKQLRGLTINGPVNLSTSGVQVHTATSSSLSSLIKVSPLKSLLREDLKRKMASRNSNSRNRSNSSPNPGNSDGNTDQSSASTTTTNGIITSTGPEQPSDSSITWRALIRRGPNGLQCNFCGIGFPDQTLYFLHKGCHSDTNPWKCNICGEQCSNVYEFNSHLLSKSHQ